MAYIPSQRVLTEGGYEGGGAMVYYGLPSPWSADVEPLIVREVHRQAARLAAPAATPAAPSAVPSGAPSAAPKTQPPPTTGPGSAEHSGARREGASPGAPSAEPPAYPDHRRLLVYRDQRGEHPVKTPDDWAIRRQHVLQGMQLAMGPLPDRSKLPPVDFRQTGRQAGDGYTLLSVSIAVEPDDRIPAHLYLPAGHDRGPPRAAILALHQTSAQGKANVGPQSDRPGLRYAHELAQRGYVVLAPDYPSFGDYKYDFQAAFKSGRYASGTMKGIVNHMRCVDLLSARPDVDPKRIGVIGHSLGGHNSMFVAAFDERIRAVVSSCGWTPFHDYYQGKIAGWTSDRYMPRLRDRFGLDADRVPFDFYEVVATLAPRPFYSNSPTRDDNFAVAGVRKAADEARQVYRLLGSESALVVRHPEVGHEFPTAQRREAYQFLDKALGHTPARDVPPAAQTNGN
jgi:hypothetical protein